MRGAPFVGSTTGAGVTTIGTATEVLTVTVMPAVTVI